MYGYFKWQTSEIVHKNTWRWLRKGNLKREIESFLITAQNNALRTNHIKVKIDNTPQNSKCRLCIDRHETINYIISECSKLAQKEYRTRHEWVKKVSHWELCKISKLSILPNVICTNQNPSLRIRRIKLSGILQYNKEILKH